MLCPLRNRWARRAQDSTPQVRRTLGDHGEVGVHRFERGQGHPLLAGGQREPVGCVQEHPGGGPVPGLVEEPGDPELGRLAGRVAGRVAAADDDHRQVGEPLRGAGIAATR